MPHLDEHLNFSINKLSIPSEDGYNHDSPENTEYVVPVTIYAEQGYGLELEDSGDEATGIQVYLSLRYKFGIWDDALGKYTNIEQLQSDVGDNGTISSNSEITFGKQIDEVDIGDMNRFENIRIPTVSELYNYYGFANPEGVDLIECEILNVYIKGDFNQTKIRLKISNDLKYPSMPDINNPSADGLGVSADGVYNSEQLEDDDELEQIYEYFKEKYSIGNFPEGHIQKDNLPIGNSQMIEMSTGGSNILRDVSDDLLSDESLPPQIETRAANVFFFEEEEESADFNIPNVNIEQTLSSSFDPFSGLDITTSSLQNTKQGLIDYNQDGRIELGLFFFEEDNLSSNDFPISFRNTIFNQIDKVNLLTNGDCKGVDKNYRFSNTTAVQKTNVIKPSGGWKFLNFDGVGFRRANGTIGDVDIEASTDETLLEYKNYYTQNIDIGGGEFIQTPQGNFGHGGYLPYIPFTDAGLDEYYKALPESSWNQMLIDGSYSPANDDDMEYDFPVDIYEDLNQPGFPFEGLDAPIPPPIASWIRTDKAYSNNRCLVFHSLNPWGGDQILNFFKYFWVFNTTNNGYESGKHSGILSLLGSDDITLGEEFLVEPADEEYLKFTENQYRVLNQSQLIHRQESDLLNPYSSLKVKFKMYTDRMTNSNVGMPQVEVGVLSTDFLTPETDGYQTEALKYENSKMSPIVPQKVGGFNSTSYYTGSNLNDKKYDYFGSMIRVENSDLDKWESFEFNFNISNMSGFNSLQTIDIGETLPEVDDDGNINLDYYNSFIDTNGLTSMDEGGVGSGPQLSSDINYNSFYAMKKETMTWTYGDLPIDEMVNPFVINTYEIYSQVVNDLYTLQSGEGGIPDPFKLIYKIEDSYGNSVTQLYPSGGFDTNNWTTERVLKTNEEYTFYFFCEFTLDVSIGEGYSSFVIQEIKQTMPLPEITINTQTDSDSESVQDVKDLLFVVQSGNDFQGRVLLDDFEVYESYEFIPDVDVRKKISVGNYGTADLTKYYDKDLQPDEYKDSTAPLEVQFYFYPTYPTDKVFDVTRTPIYQDFKKDRFYIYDIDWGDGSPNEFISEPEQINENTALYHTYETHGIFEITGFMMRLKPNKLGEPEGLAYNKRFKLRININPGLDEDFEYYGSDGFSFIPYKNTLPIIGGISKQSIYYKSVKRLLGFLDNNTKTKVSFNSKGDRLKTELALLKMENQSNDDLEVLPNYMIERFDNQGVKIYNGISPIKEELGKGIGDCDLTNIKYYNEPKSIWEMFGFEENDLSIIGNPDESRYWKNIIPEDYSIFNRDGVGLVNQPISFPKFNEVMNVTYQEELPNGDTNVLTGRLEKLLNPMGVNMTGFQLDESLRPKGYIEMVITTENPTQGWVPDKFEFANWQSFLTENPSADDLYTITWNNFIHPMPDGNDVPPNNIMINSGNGWKVGRNTIRLYFDDAYYAGPGSSFKDSPSTGWTNWNIEDGINFTIVQMNIERNISVIPEENWINNQIVNQIIVEDIKIVPTQTIDTYREQDWTGINESLGFGYKYYYPVLPKYGADGRFVDVEIDDNGDVIGGYPKLNNSFKIPFSLEGSITNEDENNLILLTNITNKTIDTNVFNDRSGNENLGLVISDYKPSFDNNTLKPNKVTKFDKIKTKTKNGAF